MGTNRLGLLSAWNGIDAPALRKVLRELGSWLRDGGAQERKLGVEQFGVFYSQTQVARYCVREHRIFQRPAVRVVKLRPPKVEVTERTDLQTITLAMNISAIGSVQFDCDPTTRAWEQTGGAYIPSNPMFYMVRSPNKPRRYALIQADFNPESAFADPVDLVADPYSLELLFIRWDSAFLMLPSGLVGGNTIGAISQTFDSTPGAGGTGSELLYDGAVLGRWCLAALRSVTIGLDEWPT